MSNFLKSLREKDPSGPIAYHLEGLLEAMERTRTQMAQVDEALDLDPEELAGRLVDLQIEIFDHIGYHMKQLRRPFQRLIDAAYKELPDLEEEEALEWLERRLSQSQTKLEVEHAKQRDLRVEKRSRRP